MKELIGLNHIFDYEQICFCLACKESITENNSVNKDDAIFQHLQSEKHESSIRSLFKTIVSDPKCESHDVKYLDIVNNSELDVWEMDNDPTYVPKRENHYICVICQKKVSHVSEEAEKVKSNLEHHLKSEYHLENIRNNVRWIYHPNIDSSYVAFHKTFMYCSFCQKNLISQENDLLRLVADHVEVEIQQLDNSNVAFKADFRSVLKGSKKIAKEKFVKKPIIIQLANPEDDMPKEGNSEILAQSSISSVETERKEEIITNTSLQLVYNDDGINNVSRESNNNFCSFKGHQNEKSSSQNLDEFNNSCTILDDESNPSVSDYNQASDSFNFKEEKTDICSVCNTKIEIYNDDISFSMLKHSQKHKDLDIKDNFEFENQKMTVGFSCHICGVQIELFNKDIVFSHRRHLERVHPDMINVQLKNNDNGYDSNGTNQSMEGFPTISKALYSMPNDFKKHVKFITLVGGNCYCNLCHCNILLANDSSGASDNLQNHFLGYYHKNQYEAYVQNNTDSGDIEFGENSQSFQCSQLNQISINKEECSDTSVLTNDLTQNNISKNPVSGFNVSNENVRSNYQVKNILVILMNKHHVINENMDFLGIRGGEFYCEVCKIMIKCSRRGTDLIKHLNEESHSNKKVQLKNLNLKGKGKARPRAVVLQMLCNLSIAKKIIAQNITFIDEKEGRFFCECCDEIVMCSFTGSRLIDHLQSSKHKETSNCLNMAQKEELRVKARPRDQVCEILKKLASLNTVVSQNLEVLGEKQGHFYCEACSEILLCSLSGKKLIKHLVNPKHQFFNSKLNNFVVDH